jgi:hypothetical protein
MKSAELGRMPILLLIALALVSSGCELVGDIFQAGMAVGVIGVVLVVALAIYLISRLRT